LAISGATHYYFRGGLLEIETGRYTKLITPLNERSCNLCSRNIVEDEIYFVMNCELQNNIVISDIIY